MMAGELTARWSLHKLTWLTGNQVQVWGGRGVNPLTFHLQRDTNSPWEDFYSAKIVFLAPVRWLFI